MILLTPRLSLVQTQMSLFHPESDFKEWIFKTSEEFDQVTGELDAIMAKCDDEYFGEDLLSLLESHPWHFEALTSYSQYCIDDCRLMDGFAYAHAAVASARSVFPREFNEGTDIIPGGFVENRSFLRCLKQLMVAQAEMGDYASASATGFQILGYDKEDRTAICVELPKYLLWMGRYRMARELFENPSFKDGFGSAQSLYPVTLLELGERDLAREAIDDCLGKPRIAKYLLKPDLKEPDPEERPVRWGVPSGSELEGFLVASEVREFWKPEAIQLLKECSGEAERQGWPAYLRRGV